VLAWGARVDGRPSGTVQLRLDTAANGRHRGEVATLMVQPNAGWTTVGTVPGHAPDPAGWLQATTIFSRTVP
jgi:hypothetical protein